MAELRLRQAAEAVLEHAYITVAAKRHDHREVPERYLDQLRAALDAKHDAEEWPNDMDSWWCPRCRDVPPDVTYEETCTACSAGVTTLHMMAEDLAENGWVVFPPEPPLEEWTDG